MEQFLIKLCLSHTHCLSSPLSDAIIHCQDERKNKPPAAGRVASGCLVFSGVLIDVLIDVHNRCSNGHYARNPLPFTRTPALPPSRCSWFHIKASTCLSLALSLSLTLSTCPTSPPASPTCQQPSPASPGPAARFCCGPRGAAQTQACAPRQIASGTSGPWR